MLADRHPQPIGQIFLRYRRFVYRYVLVVEIHARPANVDTRSIGFGIVPKNGNDLRHRRDRILIRLARNALIRRRGRVFMRMIVRRRCGPAGRVERLA